MSQLQYNQPLDGIRKPVPTPIPLPGLTETPNAPGLSVQDPVSQGLTMARQLDASLGNLYDLGGALIQSEQANKRAEEEAAAMGRRAAYENKQHELYLRGEVAQHARETLPGILDQIKSGAIGATGTPEDFARQLVNDKLDATYPADKFSEAERDQYRKSTTDEIIRAVYSKREVDRHAAKLSGIESLQNLAAGAASPTDLSDLANKAESDWGQTPLAAKGLMGGAAMNHAVDLARGDPEAARKALKTARDYLGDDFKTDQLKAQAQVDALSAKSRSDYSGQQTRDLLRLIATEPTAIAKQQFEHVRSDMSGEDIYRIQNAIEEKDNHTLREIGYIVKQQEAAQFNDEASSLASAAWEAGLGSNIPDYDRQHSDGTGFHRGKAELVEQAATQKLTQIAQDGELLGKPPDQIKGDQMRELGRNAYFFPQQKQTIEAGAASLSQAALADTKGELSPNALEGFDMFKRFAAQAPGTLDSMNLSTRTKRIFYGAMTLEANPVVGGDVTTALRTAVAAADRPPSDLDTIRLSGIAAALDITSKSDLDIARDAAPLAEMYTRLGATPIDAVNKAVDQVSSNRVKINGWSTPIGNIPPELKAEFVEVTGGIISNYASDNADAGVRAGNVAFRFNPSNNLWAMVDAITGVAMPSEDPDEVFFTTNDLIGRANKAKSDPAIQKAIFDKRLRDKMNQKGKPGFIDYMGFPQG